MRRASIGTVELTTVACSPDRDRAAGRPRVPVPGLGFTVGKRSDGLTGATLVPGIGGSATSGGSMLDEDGSVVAVLAVATTSVADAEKDSAPLAEAVAVKTTRVAGGAATDTGTEASSPTGRLAILQVAPLADGQMAKLGVPRKLAELSLATTDTVLLIAPVLQTDTMKLAVPPAVTVVVPEG
jgi:hypothetical protein